LIFQKSIAFLIIIAAIFGGLLTPVDFTFSTPAEGGDTGGGEGGGAQLGQEPEPEPDSDDPPMCIQIFKYSHRHQDVALTSFSWFCIEAPFS
jgi:hypothetical protein